MGRRRRQGAGAGGVPEASGPGCRVHPVVCSEGTAARVGSRVERGPGWTRRREGALQGSGEGGAARIELKAVGACRRRQLIQDTSPGAVGGCGICQLFKICNVFLSLLFFCFLFFRTYLLWSLKRTHTQTDKTAWGRACLLPHRRSGCPCLWAPRGSDARALSRSRSPRCHGKRPLATASVALPLWLLAAGVSLYERPSRSGADPVPRA